MVKLKVFSEHFEVATLMDYCIRKHPKSRKSNKQRHDKDPSPAEVDIDKILQ